MEYRFSSEEYFLIYMPSSSREEGDLIVVEMMNRPFEHFYEFASHCKNYACHSQDEYLNFDPKNHDKVEKFSSGFSTDKVEYDKMWEVLNSPFPRSK